MYLKIKKTMKEYIIELSKQDVEDWQREQYVVFASVTGDKLTKVMRCYLIGLWEVEINHKITYQGKDIELAIKNYNRFVN